MKLKAETMVCLATNTSQSLFCEWADSYCAEFQWPKHVLYVVCVLRQIALTFSCHWHFAVQTKSTLLLPQLFI